MKNLESLLGQIQTSKEILSYISNNEQACVSLEGPPASGKTWIAESISSAWVTAGGAAVIGVGDNANFERQYYPLNLIRSQNPSNSKSIIAATKVLIKTVDVVVPTGGIGTSIFDSLLSIGSHQRKKKIQYLNDAEQEIIYDLKRRARKKPLLLVADNVHWWDKSSLKFIHELCFNEYLRRDFDFLTNMRVLFVRTDESSQPPIALEYLQGYIYPRIANSWRIDYSSSENVLTILQHFGLKVRVDSAMQDFIYEFCGGHLVLLSRVASFLNEADEASLLSSKDQRSRHFVEELIAIKIRDLHITNNQLLELMEFASLIGIELPRILLQCLISDSKQLDSLLHVAHELTIIEKDGERIHFSHDFYRTFFENRIPKGKKASYHASIANCLRSNRASDYGSRFRHLLLAGNESEAAVMLCLSIVHQISSGARSRSNMVVERKEQDFLRKFNLLEVAIRFDAIYKLLRGGHYINALKEVEKSGYEHPLPIVAELDLVHAKLTAMINRTKSAYKAAASKLSKWDMLMLENSGLFLRIYSVLIQMNVMAEEFEEAKLAEEKLVMHVAERAYSDPVSIGILRGLDSRASSMYTPEVAVYKVEKAVDYFRSSDQNSYSNMLEYYKALVNYSAILVKTGDYAGAYAVSKRTEELILENKDDLDFPRLDTLANNMVIAGYYAGEYSTADSLEKQKQVCDSPFGVDDNIHTVITLAGFHILSQQYMEADKVLQNVESTLRKQHINETYVLYPYLVNKIGMLHLMGKTTEARELLKSMDEMIASLNWPVAGFIKARHSLIEESFERVDPGNPLAYDLYLLDKYSGRYESAWQYWGRGISIAVLQFWIT